MNSQPEFKTEIWDYLSALVDDQRVQDGTAAVQQWGRALANAEARFGVDRYVIAGVWGVEFGFRQEFRRPPAGPVSRHPLLLRARASGLFHRRVDGDAQDRPGRRHRSAALKGSWAGAFGHTQFMPSTFQRLAVDGDGDGRRDVVSSVPDALASTANFLKKAGWVNGLLGLRSPAAIDFSPRSPAARRSAIWPPGPPWASPGSMADPCRELCGGCAHSGGHHGPAFIVTKKFDAVYSYNAAESHGLAIALLGDRLKGFRAFGPRGPRTTRRSRAPNAGNCSASDRAGLRRRRARRKGRL